MLLNCMILAGPAWHQPKGKVVLLPAWPSGATIGQGAGKQRESSIHSSMQYLEKGTIPHRMTHCLHGGGNHDNNGSDGG